MQASYGDLLKDMVAFVGDPVLDVDAIEFPLLQLGIEGHHAVSFVRRADESRTTGMFSYAICAREREFHIERARGFEAVELHGRLGVYCLDRFVQGGFHLRRRWSPVPIARCQKSAKGNQKDQIASHNPSWK